MTDDTPRPWHRLFGITLTDLFAGTSWRVELEKELALRSQLLDIVIIERSPEEPDAAGTGHLELPDGLEGLRRHNLLTYKSQHEALDGWAIEELIGHYVNYRKLLSGPKQQAALPPEQDFRLYAVATRFPAKLQVGLDLAPTAWDGVFDLAWGLRRIRLIVLGAIAKHPRNAPWELFSAELDRIRHGLEHYHPRSPEAGALLHALYRRYLLELPTMAYTLQDFARDSRRSVLEDLTPEERRAFLQRLPPEECQAFLQQLPLEARLRGLPAEARLRGLTPADLRRLKERLDQLDAAGETEEPPAQ
jgi:hypothetical protein